MKTPLYSRKSVEAAIAAMTENSLRDPAIVKAAASMPRDHWLPRILKALKTVGAVALYRVGDSIILAQADDGGDAPVAKRGRPAGKRRGRKPGKRGPYKKRGRPAKEDTAAPVRKRATKRKARARKAKATDTPPEIVVVTKKATRKAKPRKTVSKKAMAKKAVKKSAPANPEGKTAGATPPEVNPMA